MAIKVIIGEHLLPAGSAPASYEKRIEFGVEVKNVLGYYALVVQNGGVIPEQCRVTFANASKTLFEPVGLAHLMVNQSVAIKDRFFKEEPFDVNGFLQTRLSIPTATTSPMIVQYILLVETTK